MVHSFQENITQSQLWQFADQCRESRDCYWSSALKQIKVDFITQLFTAQKSDQIQQALENRKKQGLQVDEVLKYSYRRFSESITDDSKYMMTSIPYSDGWKVKVDGKFVQTSKAWNAFLAFPISKGNHKVEFVFRQKGVILGALLSIVSITYLVIQMRRSRSNEGR